MLGKTELAVIPTTLKAKQYNVLLEDYVFRFYAVYTIMNLFLCVILYLFMLQKFFKNWILETDTTILPWPAKYSDLSPIEKIWAKARMVNSNGR